MSNSAVPYSDLFDFEGYQNQLKKTEGDVSKFATSVIAVNKQIEGSYNQIVTRVKEISTAAAGKNSTKELVALAKELDKNVESGTRMKQTMEQLNSTVSANERSIGELKLLLSGLKKEYESLSPTQADFAQRQQDIAQRVKDATASLSSQSQVLKIATKSANDVAKSYSELSRNTGLMKEELRQMPNAFDATTGAINRHNKAAVQLQKQIQINDKALKQMDASMGNHQRNVGNYGSAFTKLGGIAADLAPQLLGVGTVLQAITSAVGTIDRLERMNIALENASGSTAAFLANRDMVRGLADKTGQDIEALTKSYVKFTAATQGSTLEGERANQIFSSFSKTFAALGASGENAGRGLLAIEQMISKGTVSAEELRQQLGDALPGSIRIFMEAYKEVSGQTDITVAKFLKLMKEGKVLSEEILPVVARRLEEAYGDKAERNLRTISGSFGNLTNQVKFLLEALNQRGIVSSFFSTLLNGASNVVKFLQQNNWVALINPAAALGGPRLPDDNLKFEQRTEEERLNIIQRKNKKLVELSNERDRILKASNVSKIYVDGMKEALAKVNEDIKAQEANINNLLIAHDRVVAMEKFDKSMEAPALISGDDDKIKRTTSQFEKLVIQLDNLRDVLMDETLKDVQAGKAISLPQKTLDRWNKLYETLRKTAELSGAELPKKIREFNEALNPGLKNILDDDSNTVYGRIGKVDKPEKAETKKLYDTPYGLLTEAEFNKLEIDVEKIAKEEERLNKVREGQRERVANLQTRFDTGDLRNISKYYKEELMKILKEIQDLELKAEDDKTRALVQATKERFSIKEREAKDELNIRRMVTEESVRLAEEMINSLFEINSAYRQAEMDANRKAMENDLALVGDNKEAQDRIKKQYHKKELELKREQAKADKVQAVFSIVLSTAKAIAAALTIPIGGIALAAIAGAIGAIQLATVAARPIPQFYKGTQYAPEGFAEVAERGPELRESKGRMYYYDKPQVAYLEKGDKIFTASETAGMLDNIAKREQGNAILQRVAISKRTREEIQDAQYKMTVHNTASLDYDRLIEGFGRQLDKRPVLSTTFDERGVSRHYESRNARIKYLNKRMP